MPPPTSRLDTGLAWVATILAWTNVVLPAALLFVIATGMWPDTDAFSDSQLGLRLIAGAGAAFFLFLSTELLLNRRILHRNQAALTDFAVELRSLQNQIVPEADGVLKLRDSLQPWTATIAGRMKLDMLGLSLRSFTREHLGYVEEMCGRGGTCRFLVVNPGSAASKMVSDVLLSQPDPTEYDAEIRGSLRLLSELRSRFPEQLAIKTLDYVPAASITVMDHGEPSAAAVIEIYTKEHSSVRRPHLQLRPAHSPIWYGYFCSQFEELWNVARDYPRTIA